MSTGQLIAVFFLCFASYVIGLWQSNFRNLIEKKVIVFQMLNLVDKFLMLHTKIAEEHIVALKKEMIDLAESHGVNHEV